MRMCDKRKGECGKNKNEKTTDAHVCVRERKEKMGKEPQRQKWTSVRFV